MSYEPTLIISKEDLLAKADLIRAYFIKKIPRKESEKEKRKRLAHIALDEALMQEGIKIKSIHLILIKPELTGHNNDVRQLLHELNIEFTVYN